VRANPFLCFPQVPDPRYSPGNRSVTQSSFASPRQPLAGGFDSDLWLHETRFPVSTIPCERPEWCAFAYLQVYTRPHEPAVPAVWLYCRKTEYTHGPVVRLRRLSSPPDEIISIVTISKCSSPVFSIYPLITHTLEPTLCSTSSVTL
jgi:hypothetical protein